MKSNKGINLFNVSQCYGANFIIDDIRSLPKDGYVRFVLGKITNICPGIQKYFKIVYSFLK